MFVLRHATGGLVVLGVLTVVVLALSGSAVAETRTPSAWPFTETSPWNSALGSDAKYELPTCDSEVQAEVGDAARPTINAASWSVPIFTASASDPQKTIYKSATPNLPYPHDTSQGTYAMPPNAQPSAEADHELVVVEPGGTFSDEMWHTYLYPTWVNVGDFARHNLMYGEGFQPDPQFQEAGFGPRAGNASYMGGLIRTWELQAGSIRHALKIALTRQRMTPSSVAPASSIDSDHGDYTGTIPMGQLLTLPPPPFSIDSLGLTSAAGRTIATALQTYGAYLVETAGALTLNAEPSAESLVAPARTVTNGDNDIMRIVRKLQCVSNNQGPPWGGGGTPRAPLPPPFG
jgi:hypothetical protein